MADDAIYGFARSARNRRVKENYFRSENSARALTGQMHNNTAVSVGERDSRSTRIEDLRIASGRFLAQPLDVSKRLCAEHHRAARRGDATMKEKKKNIRRRGGRGGGGRRDASVNVRSRGESTCEETFTGAYVQHAIYRYIGIADNIPRRRVAVRRILQPVVAPRWEHSLCNFVMAL